MKKEFVMRGQTASGQQEVLNFSGHTKGYAYRIVEFVLFPTTNIGGASYEMYGSITAGKTAVAPTDPNFNDEGLIATATFQKGTEPYQAITYASVLNDTFLITQNLILMVQDTGGSVYPINWQCRFVSEKMSGPEEAVANYNQFTISDG